MELLPAGKMVRVEVQFRKENWEQSCLKSCQEQLGWGPEQPDLVNGIPAHSRGLEQDDV